MKIKSLRLVSGAIAAMMAAPVLAGHLFTQNTNNTPTWIQQGEGIQSEQESMEGTNQDGGISIDFAANSSVPDGADTSTDDWWAWSAGDVLRFTVPTDDDSTLGTTIAYDPPSGSCTVDLCASGSQSKSSLDATLAEIGTTNLAVSRVDVSSGNPLVWTFEALQGEFSLAGYRIDYANGRPNGTGAGQLTQDSVIDSGELETGGTPDIDTSQGTFGVSDLIADNVSNTFDGGTLTVDVDGDVASDFTVGSNGGRIDTAGRDAEFTGDFTGDGAVEKSGAGILILSGENTHGGTTVTGGTLVAGSGSALGAPGTTVTLDGGTLATLQSMTLDHALDIGANGGGLAAASGTVLSQNRAITGSGDLTLSGAGTVVVNGAPHSHSGDVHVDAGLLRVEGPLTSRRVVVGPSGRAAAVAPSAGQCDSKGGCRRAARRARPRSARTSP